MSETPNNEWRTMRRTDDGVCFSNTSFAPIMSQISSAVKRVCYAEERKKGTGRSDLFNRRAKGTLVFSILLNSSNSYSKRCKVDAHASLPQIAPNLPNRLETGLSVTLKEYAHLHQRRIKNASIGYVETICWKRNPWVLLDRQHRTPWSLHLRA